MHNVALRYIKIYFQDLLIRCAVLPLDMLVEPGGGSEGLVAVPALEWLLPGVDAPVIMEVSR